MTERECFVLSHATGPCIEAEVLVSSVSFSARYDLDRRTGIFTRDGHPLKGSSIAGKILVAPGVQGGVAAGWAFPAMADLGVGFAGLVFGQVNPVMVQGAVTAGIPIAAGFDPDLLKHLKTGDRVMLDPGSRQIVLLG